MAQVIPIQGASGQIYRCRLYRDLADIPSSPGLFCMIPPLAYPGAPFEPVLWGRAVMDLRATISTDNVLTICRRYGATQAVVLELLSETARRRTLRDLMEVYPAFLNDLGNSVREVEPRRKETRPHLRGTG